MAHKYIYKALFCMSSGSLSMTHAETAECERKTISSWFRLICLIPPIQNWLKGSHLILIVYKGLLVTTSSNSDIPAELYAALEYSCTSGQVTKAAWRAKKGEKKTWEGAKRDLSTERASGVVHIFRSLSCLSEYSSVHSTSHVLLFMRFVFILVWTRIEQMLKCPFWSCLTFLSFPKVK